MSLYRQSIIVFGVVVPILITIAIIVAGSMVQSNMTESYDKKLNAFKAYEVSRKESNDIEAKVIGQRVHLERWTNLLSEETASAVTSNLREISEKLPNKEIQQTSFERVSGGSGFGTVSAQKSSQVRIAYRGTYRTLQRAFLALETRMPQLQMQDMKLDVAANNSSLVNLQLTYTAWEND